MILFSGSRESPALSSEPERADPDERKEGAQVGSNRCDLIWLNFATLAKV